jgi:hypothetical protein
MLNHWYCDLGKLRTNPKRSRSIRARISKWLKKMTNNRLLSVLEIWMVVHNDQQSSALNLWIGYMGPTLFNVQQFQGLPMYLYPKCIQVGLNLNKLFLI